MTNKAIAIGIGNIKQHGGFQDLDEALILMDKATKKAIKDSSENITNFIDYGFKNKNYVDDTFLFIFWSFICVHISTSN